jgi:hypothetical protein
MTINKGAYSNITVYLAQTFKLTKEPDVTMFTETLHKYA